MKYLDFENGLKGKFQNADEQVDVNALILNIHNAKPGKERKIVFWFLLGIAILTLGLIGMNISADSDFSIAPSPSTSIQTHQPITETSNATQPSNDQVDEPVQNQFNSPQSPTNKIQEALTEKNTSFIPPILSESVSEKDEVLPEINTYETSLTIINDSSSREADKASNRLNSDFDEGMSSQAKMHLGAINGIQSLDHKLEEERFYDPNFIICPTFKKPIWAVDLIPEVGLILPFKRLVSNSQEPGPVFNMRSEDEKTLEGLQAALYLRARSLQKPFYIKFGASYTRVSERMNLNTTWVESDTTVGIISITQSQSGDTITTILGDIITETEHFRTSSDHYYLHLIDLPLSLGYNKGLGKGWRLGAEAGVQFNLSFSSSGKLLEGSGEDSFTNLPADGRFRARLGLSYFGGLTLEKTISPRTALYVSPRVRFFSNPFTTDSYNIRQNYSFVGLHAGAIYTIK